MMRTQPAARQASTTAHTMGRPPMGKTTLGRSDFMRVPLPAARMMAVGVMGVMGGNALPGGVPLTLDGEGGVRSGGHRPGGAVPQAGRPGFEPGQTEPKSAVLP